MYINVVWHYDICCSMCCGSSMLGVLARVVSEYGAAVGASAELDRALLSARERLRAETQAVQALLRLQGALETVVR